MARFTLLFGNVSINDFLARNDIYLKSLTRKYKLEKLIGSGTFGDVFIADINGEKLALKIAPPYDEIRNEIVVNEKLKRVCGGYVTCYIESFEYNHPIAGKFLVIVQELMDGDLLTYNFKVKDLSQLLLDLLIAVDCLHQHNIAHMDIKPENILLKKSPFLVKLADLGLICDKENIIDACVVRGTYLPPNVIDNISLYQKTLPFDQARNIDLWGLGVSIIINLTLLGYYDPVIVGKLATGTYAGVVTKRYIPMPIMSTKMSRKANTGFIPQNIVEEILQVLLSYNTKRTAHGILINLIRKLKLAPPGEEEILLERWKRENTCFEQV